MLFFFLILCLNQLLSIHSLEINTGGCDKEYGCFRQPSNCENTNCDYFVSWKNEGDSIDFSMGTKMLSNSGYFAIGFSKDVYMGDDSVVMCFNQNIGPNNIQSFYNPENDYNSEILDSNDPNLGLSNIQILQENGFLSCSFKRKTFIDFQKYFDLNKPFYLLMAKGDALYENSKFTPTQHNENPLMSLEPINFTNTQSVSASSNPIKLVKSHGIIMTFGWMFLSTLGILLARYYKYLGKNKTLCGVQIWFAFHRPLMLTTSVLSLVGFLLILIRKDWKWTSSAINTNFAHSIMGILTIGISVIQPISAIFRPDKDSANRPIFNWLHRVFGILAFILSYVAITLAIKFFLQKYLWLIMVGWLSWLILVVIALEFIDYKITKNWKTESVINTQIIEKNDKNMFDSSFKTVILGLHFVISICFTFAIILLIWIK